MQLRRAAAAAACIASASAAGFYLPGVEQREYERGDTVGPIDVNSLTSIDGVIPYPYYSLKFCRPSREMREERLAEEKLGEVLWGDHIEPSMYLVEMMVDMKCKPVACEEKNRQMSQTDLKLFEKRINAGYRGNLIVDNLPVVSNMTWVMNRQCPSGKEIHDWQLRGFPLGVSAACLLHPDATEGTCHIHNHLHFQMQVNEVRPNKFIIVGFYVIPRSIDHVDLGACDSSFVSDGNHPPITTELPIGQKSKRIIWSYSVRWERKQDIFWATRWDAYLNSSFANSNARVHWLSIINSLLIVLCLSAVVAMILMRTLHLDFNRYNDPEHQDEAQEEVGWKLVHADVFRPPAHEGLFSIFIGTGVQLLGMFALSLFFALIGFLSPANRGGLITATMLLYVLMSIANGLVTGITLKMFHARQWKTVFGAGLLYPGLIFGLWLAAEFVIWSTSHKKGANTAPLLSVLAIMGLWFGISLPLVVLGASFGFRGPMIEPPVKVQKIERPIPPQRWYLQDICICLFPGIIPFGAAFIELRFILSSIWQGMVYYVFGFLALTYFTVVITVAEVTIVIVYFMLVFENHKWWWRSVAIPGSMALHFFVYSIFYFETQLQVHTWLATLIYFQTMGLVSLSLYIACGTIGALSCFVFIRIIYSSIKIE
eukprot:TRINITY_DN983_c0_g1_i8.p2 TRINITY_DN983_c0_g1~~TRINITY_DN983_c0_g1_i8.p2  ORF type:complete len:688 (+),score=306.03 TRINITY_DN983_c0_g1_i8:105-2066(+)